jgi:hypothetical protein
MQDRLPPPASESGCHPAAVATLVGSNLGSEFLEAGVGRKYVRRGRVAGLALGGGFFVRRRERPERAPVARPTAPPAGRVGAREWVERVAAADGALGRRSVTERLERGFHRVGGPEVEVGGEATSAFHCAMDMTSSSSVAL